MSESFRKAKNLSKKEREIMYMRYGFGGKMEMTQKQVADYFEISQSYISRLEKRKTYGFFPPKKHGNYFVAKKLGKILARKTNSKICNSVHRFSPRHTKQRFSNE